MKPWKYDYTVHPITWRSEEESEAKNKTLRVGLMATDGMFQVAYSSIILIEQVSFLPLRLFNAL
jgi:hypothetical protein